MSSVSELLRKTLKANLTPVSRCCVALSGGLDSSVLLHGLCELRGESDGLAIRAVHVDHALQPESANWAVECRNFCEKLDVPLHSEIVQVDRSSGDGLESAARRARYALFSSVLGEGEYLLTAHHEDDQLETFLLRLLRGAGTRGLGSIGERRRLGRGWLLRPLLDVNRSELEAHARVAGIHWIEDPSNTDIAIDRNFLRHEVVPQLRGRWPGLAQTVGRAARLARESAGLLDGLAEADGRGLMAGDTVDIAALSRLEPPRRRNFIRYLARSRGLVVPSEAQLNNGLEQLLSARLDGQPVLRWQHGQIRRYRGRLHVLEFDPEIAAQTLPPEYEWDGSEALDMGLIRGRLRLQGAHGGLSEASVSDGLTVRYRRGGERIRRTDQQHHQSLKNLFQASGILPWMRSHVPLLYRRDQLLAVGDLWLADDATATTDESGYRVVWENHAAIE